MFRKIGLSGAHRVGKTTLCEKISEQLDIKLLKINTIEVFNKLNIKPSDSFRLDYRLYIQRKILEHFHKKISLCDYHSSFITDRTPIDFIGYMLADINSDTFIDNNELLVFIEDCYKVINECIKYIIVIQPGIPLKYEEGKAKLNKSYIELLNTIIIGSLYNEKLYKIKKKVIEREVIKIEDRIELIKELFFNKGKLNYETTKPFYYQT